MRILVRDGVAGVPLPCVGHDCPPACNCGDHRCGEDCRWRPLDDRPEDREAREAWERVDDHDILECRNCGHHQTGIEWRTRIYRTKRCPECDHRVDHTDRLPGLYELVEEHHTPGCKRMFNPLAARFGPSDRCTCPAGWPRKTLRRAWNA